ncbi:unnamed protein product [Soboliphyme baturini]|uniref:ELM2 domain-containing protein n=1 Tax=Soboliphyme baturini TaxID=241478 RepID=A0A183IX83_9BILA|nr:unnamed protein product [Soboliphyme baturini]
MVSAAWSSAQCPNKHVTFEPTERTVRTVIISSPGRSSARCLQRRTWKSAETAGSCGCQPCVARHSTGGGGLNCSSVPDDTMEMRHFPPPSAGFASDADGTAAEDAQSRPASSAVAGQHASVTAAMSVQSQNDIISQCKDLWALRAEYCDEERNCNDAEDTDDAETQRCPRWFAWDRSEEECGSVSSADSNEFVAEISSLNYYLAHLSIGHASAHSMEIEAIRNRYFKKYWKFYESSNSHASSMKRDFSESGQTHQGLMFFIADKNNVKYK